MASKIKDLGAYYLDSYASRYMCNDKRFILGLRPKSYEFIISKEEIIRLEEVGLVHPPTNSKATITLKNVIYTLRCNSKLISPGQLQESSINYHNQSKYMILKQG